MHAVSDLYIIYIILAENKVHDFASLNYRGSELNKLDYMS